MSGKRTKITTKMAVPPLARHNRGSMGILPMIMTRKTTLANGL
ncbi:MAG TPA: hypothetical protein PLO37_20715 [Candidatus Hydrogenedentes bacterium]|nr:hypothetical protein [Candidatus Hydrogenedentota bacterium]